MTNNYATNNDFFAEAAARLGQHLLEQGLRVAVAESCTGGWLAKVCTDIAGSSQWFDRGFVTYSNAAKRDMLSVNARVLDKYGAVSEQVVREMAMGAMKHSLADVAVAITGIAGPDGGSAEKPVGTVWFAWAVKNNQRQLKIETEQHLLAGGRDDIRGESVKIALEGLLGIVQNLP